uniref:Amino acid transporter transmembrane domain-containing protein n=1 Tax=Clastoptera arizonana TaxID=38151 RepID=A0A1B6EEK5_9HEMI
MLVEDGKKNGFSESNFEIPGHVNHISMVDLIASDVDKQKPPKQAMGEDFNLRTSQFATTDFGTFLSVLKSSLGSGILAMPNAFLNAGLFLGLVLSVIVGFICSHCTYILVKSSQELCRKSGMHHYNYPETTQATFEYSMNGRFARYAQKARTFNNMCILVVNYGAGVIYIILAAETFKQVLENHIHTQFNIRWYVLVLSLPILPVSIIRRMKYMVPFSAMANALILGGLLLVFYYIFKDPLPPIESRPMFAHFTRVPLAFATILFGMEGVGVVLPIENSMKNPSNFLGWKGVFSRAMAFVILLSLVTGAFGYIKYGDDVKGSISLNLPNTILAEVIKVLVAVAIVCTYGLQIMAAAQVFWMYLESHVSKEYESVAYYGMRIAMVTGHIIASIIVPQLAPVISLIASVGLSILGLALPALIETITFWEDGGLGIGRWRLYKNIFLGLLAIFTLVTGTYTSMKDIIDAYTWS